MRIEPMKRHLAPALFSLSLCAVMGGVQTAGAQAAELATAPAIDTATMVSVAPIVPPAAVAAAPVVAAAPARATLMAPAAVGVTAPRVGRDDAPLAPAAVMVDW